MRAMLVDASRKLVWTQVPDPVMKEDQVLIQIHAAALNRADLLQRQGTYPSPEGWPEWMGLEISGVIIQVGQTVLQKSAWRVGDKVCALLGGGGYAEKVAVPYQMIMPAPQGLTMEEAAALPEAFATSYLNLFMEGRLKEGETAFIPAGASGLASAAIPLAKAFGARVITSVLSDEAAARIRHLGADIVINSTTQSVAQALKKEADNGQPVNVAMDCLAGEALGQCLPYMARGGSWIVISTLAGDETVIPLRALLTKGLHLAGSMLRNRTPDTKAFILKELVDKVWPKLEAGEIKPCIYKVLPMEQAEEAHRILEQGKHAGKIVLRVQSN